MPTKKTSEMSLPSTGPLPMKPLSKPNTLICLIKFCIWNGGKSGYLISCGTLLLVNCPSSNLSIVTRLQLSSNGFCSNKNAVSYLIWLLYLGFWNILNNLTVQFCEREANLDKHEIPG